MKKIIITQRKLLCREFVFLLRTVRRKNYKMTQNYSVSELDDCMAKLKLNFEKQQAKCIKSNQVKFYQNSLMNG